MSEPATMQIGMESKKILTDTTTVPGKTIITVPVTDRSYKRKMKLQSHEPKDYSDLGQAEVFSAEFGDIIRWTPGTGFLVYDGRVWNKSDNEARKQLQTLTMIQLKESEALVQSATQESLKAAKFNNKAMMEAAAAKMNHAQNWFKYAVKRRDSNKISNALTETASMVSISIDKFDADPFLLNTPAGTVNLRTGEIQDHNPSDLLTKITAVSPDDVNRDMFYDFLDKLTEGDADLQDYLQQVVGMCAVGEVSTECLIICQGSGGNGKSTFWNLILKVFGSYSTTMDADSLTDERIDKRLENASLKGVRLALYPELKQGKCLDMGQVKRISSTDKIRAKSLYKDPFEFWPTHTPVVYANELPRVTAIDRGSWDRLVFIPFQARLRNTADEKTKYSDILFDNCGGAVLSWIIDGAKKYIDNGRKLITPECVRQATDSYQMENNWFNRFERMMCETGPGYRIKASELYHAYEQYTQSHGEPKRSMVEFGKAYRAAGFQTKKRNGANFVFCIQLKSLPPAAPNPPQYTQVEVETPFTDQQPEPDDDMPF